MPPSPRCILSLYDRTGAWSQPYWKEGHNIIEIDKENEDFPFDANQLSATWLSDNVLDSFGMVDGILSAPPCTDFTVSGAQYWKAKDEDGRTQKSLELALMVFRCVDFLKPDWWVLENPVGRLPRLVEGLGKPPLIFDPCDYDGWIASAEDLRALDAIRGRKEFTVEDIELVKRTNAYTKRTCLWGEFKLPEKRRIDPVKVCAQGSWLQRLGGASQATKEARSATPLGFAKAFHAVNRWKR